MKAINLLLVLLLTICCGGVAQAQEETTTPVVGDDVDENGCIGSAGFSFCEGTGECIQPFETECPFAGPSTIECNDGSCSVNSTEAGGTCAQDQLPEGSSISTGGDPIVIGGVNGTVEIPEGCTFSCTYCFPPTEKDAGSTEDPAAQEATSPPAAEATSPPTEETTSGGVRSNGYLLFYAPVVVWFGWFL